MKLKRANDELFKNNTSRIVEVDDETEAAMGMFDDNSGFDMKYELFCKWLRQSGRGALLEKESNREVNSSTILTEDEVSSFATNSEDSGSDIFLDTESDFPSIVLNNENNEQMPFNAEDEYANNRIDSLMGEFRVDTPSQLSVSDYDCSSSDITVSSKLSALSNQPTKRKAKHKKGKAPPIPATASKSPNNSDDNNYNGHPTIELTKNTTSLNDTSFYTRSTRETDI